MVDLPSKSNSSALKWEHFSFALNGDIISVKRKTIF